MKSILEASIYLFLTALICYAGIDFIQMNLYVSKVNETTQYMRDYIEINGQVLQGQSGEYFIDGQTMGIIKEKADKNDMLVECKYIASTDDYAYYDLDVTYKFKLAFFKIDKKRVSSSMVRLAL